MSKLDTLCAVMVMVAASAASGQTTWHVDDDNCPGPGTGTQVDPFCAIQAGIDAAVDGDEVLVAAGTYNEVINFNGKAITLRSAGGEAVTTIDGTGLDDSVVKCISGEGPDTVLKGFTITGGTGSVCRPGADHDKCGGGMRNMTACDTVCVGSSPTVTDCTFTGNSADWGAGMWNLASRLEDPYGPFVGGNPTVTNCTFHGNTATGSGGGMYSYRCSPTVLNCTFSENAAGGDGGGMYNNANSPTVVNCAFRGNSAGMGGGMNNTDGNATVTGCVFVGNSAGYFGGGMMISQRGTSSVVNCTFSRNSASTGAALMLLENSFVTLTNSILWGDSPDEIGVVFGDERFTVSYSNVQGGLSAGWIIDAGGNIDADPLFVDVDGADDTIATPDDDLRLSAGSPAIDAGNTLAFAGPIADVGGNGRAVDDPATPDTGIPFVGIAFPFLPVTIDMGAHEFPVTPLDYNHDGLVDLIDFVEFLKVFTGP